MIDFLSAYMAPIMFGALILFLLIGYSVAFSLAACGLLFGLIGVELGLMPGTRRGLVGLGREPLLARRLGARRLDPDGLVARGRGHRRDRRRARRVRRRDRVHPRRLCLRASRRLVRDAANLQLAELLE